MRLLHTADCHLGNFMLGGDKEKEAFAALIETALVIRPDVLVVAGDLFDHGRVSDDVIAWTLEQMSRLDCPVVVLPGNHDYDVLMRIAAGADLAQHPGITIITAPDGELVQLPELDLTLWGKALEEHTPDYRPLTGIPARPARGWCVVLGHGLIVDALNSGGRGSPIFPADVEAVEWDYVALGHVHAHRIIQDQPAPPVLYSGATTMARGGQPGAVLVEFRPGTGVSYESIDLAASRENAVS
jgi:DNA repair protein SbcD/Mre11